MNRSLLEKAISKGQAKGLPPSGIVDLYETYLEVAEDIPPPLIQPTAADIAAVSASTTSVIEPPKIGKVIGVVQSQDNPWTVDSLFNALATQEWKFSVKAPGSDHEFVFNSTIIKSPRGMDGVAICFRCPELSTAEFPMFFPISEAKIDPEKSISELKANIEYQLRPREKPITTAALQPSAPPNFAQLANGGDGAGGFA